MGLKGNVKQILGMIRVKMFNVDAKRGVYIGKHCNLKGSFNIKLEEFLTIRPYVQFWSGGQLEQTKAQKLVNDVVFLL